MNYIGSKLSLLDFLEKSIEKVAGKKHKIFCDFFAGTGAVGIHFKKKGYQVCSNDIQYYSFVLNRHYVGNHKNLIFSGLTKELPGLKNGEAEDRAGLVCDHLNSLDGLRGFIYKNYCPGGASRTTGRQYFSNENGKKCDAIRQKIE